MRTLPVVLLAAGACTVPDPGTTGVPSMDGGQFGNEGPPLPPPVAVALVSGRAFGVGELELLRTVASDPTGVGGLGRALVAADLDEDGLFELGVDTGDERTRLFAGAPGTQALRPDPVAVIRGPSDPEDPPRAVGDLDGDGFLELAAWSGSPTDRRIALYAGGDLLAAGGAEVEPWIRFPAGPGRLPVSLGDLDGDGAPELALIDASSLLVVSGVDLQRGDGEPVPVRTTLSVPAPTWLDASGDVDGDGGLDLAVTTAEGEVRLYAGQALMDGVGPLAWSRLPDPMRLVPLGDVDGDGRDDLGLRSLDGPAGPTGGQLIWLSGATLAAGGERAPSAGPLAVQLCSVGSTFGRDLTIDLDRDGVREWFYVGHDMCRVSVPTLVQAAGTDHIPLVSRSPYRVSDLVALGDIDGDGVPDLAVTSYGP